MDRLKIALCALAALAAASCMGTRSDIDFTLSVTSVNLVRTGGKLSGTVSVSIALGAFAPASHTLRPQSLDIAGSDGHSLGTLNANMPPGGFNTAFMPGDTRTATFPLSCDATGDCGAASACAMGSVMTVFTMFDDTTTPATPKSASLGATVDCSAP